MRYLLPLLLAFVIAPAHALITPVGKTWLLTDCGEGLANFDGCPTANPKIAFTDFINGPDTGLGDGLGSGTIVTIWGHNLGDTQGDSTIQYCDSGATCRNGYVYYWKRADGTLPGGPADLYSSHRMQEIAFSIPDSDLGAGTISITVGETTVTTPFTVRAGSIYHVKNDGNNSTGDGAFDTPWATVSRDTDGALKNIVAGDIVYSHGVVETSEGNGAGRAIYMSSRVGSLASQTGLSAYPGTRPTASAAASSTATVDTGINARSFQFFLSDAVVVSKYRALDGSYLEPEPTSTDILTGGGNSSGIPTTANGRIVGNYISDPEGHCPSGVAGAIVGGASNGYDQISNAKIFGNHIDDYGCDQTSHFHHTTYFTNRSGNQTTVTAWEIAYNHLSNNKAKYGIHNYDQPLGGACSDVTGTLQVHNNVIYNQKGAGITFAGQEPATATDGDPGICWTADFTAEYNHLNNVGLGPPDENGISSSAILFQDGGMSGTATINNNTVYNWSDADRNGGDVGIGLANSSPDGQLSYVITKNIFYSDQDVLTENFLTAYTSQQITDLFTATDNYWYYSGAGATRWVVPSWDSAPKTIDPSIMFNGVVITSDGINSTSEAGSGAVDLYGTTRFTSFYGAGVE